MRRLQTEHFPLLRDFDSDTLPLDRNYFGRADVIAHRNSLAIDDRRRIARSVKDSLNFKLPFCALALRPFSFANKVRKVLCRRNSKHRLRGSN